MDIYIKKSSSQKYLWLNLITNMKKIGAFFNFLFTIFKDNYIIFLNSGGYPTTQSASNPYKNF